MPEDVILLVVGVVVSTLFGLQMFWLQRVQKRVDIREERTAANIQSMKDEFGQRLHEIELRQIEQNGKMALLEAALANHKGLLASWSDQLRAFTTTTGQLQTAVQTLMATCPMCNESSGGKFGGK